MEPIKNNDNEKIEEIKDIEKNEMKELSPEELEGVAGGIGKKTEARYRF